MRVTTDRVEQVAMETKGRQVGRQVGNDGDGVSNGDDKVQGVVPLGA